MRSRPVVSGTQDWKALPPAALSSVFNGPSCVSAYATSLAGSRGESQRSANSCGLDLHPGAVSPAVVWSAIIDRAEDLQPAGRSAWARYASLVNRASVPGTPQAWTRRLLRCGVAAGPAFVAVFSLEGAVRDGYRPLRHPVSSLALGPRGWIQAGNFAVAGTLFLAGAAGLARAGDAVASSRSAPALIGAAGAGLIGAAIFSTDPVSGYPPGTPDALTRPSRTGTLHNLAAIPVFLGLPAAALACGWRSWLAGQNRFSLYSCGSAVTMLTTMVLAGAGFGQSPRLVNLGGLFQRTSIITGFAWLTTLSAQALRRHANHCRSSMSQ